jgi:hypothetical protein
MDTDIGGAVIGIAAFLSMFVVAYFCRRKTPEITPPPPPIVVVHRDEDPGDPS